MNLRQQHRPVIRPLVQAQNVLAQPAPELFNRVEPVSIGGQADNFQTRQCGEYAEDIRMGMNRPVVLNDKDALGERIRLVKALVQFAHLAPPDDVVIQIGDLAGQGVQRPDEPPLSVIASTRQDGVWHRRAGHPGQTALRPAKEAEFSDEHQHHGVRMAAAICKQST